MGARISGREDAASTVLWMIAELTVIEDGLDARVRAVERSAPFVACLLAEDRCKGATHLRPLLSVKLTVDEFFTPQRPAQVRVEPGFDGAHAQPAPFLCFVHPIERRPPIKHPL